jgi:hypothetical protein
MSDQTNDRNESNPPSAPPSSSSAPSSSSEFSSSPELPDFDVLLSTLSSFSSSDLPPLDCSLDFFAFQLGVRESKIMKQARNIDLFGAKLQSAMNELRQKQSAKDEQNICSSATNEKNEKQRKRMKLQ